MNYSLEEFCRDCRNVLAQKAPINERIEQIAEKLAVLLRNEAFVTTTFNESTPPGKRELYHDPDRINADQEESVILKKTSSYDLGVGQTKAYGPGVRNPNSAAADLRPQRPRERLRARDEAQGLSPQLNLHIVPDCKHIVPWDAKQDVARLAFAFLEVLSGQRWLAFVSSRRPTLA